MTKYNEYRVDVMLPTTIGVGNLIFEGVVTNISANGFKVVDLPLRFDSDEEKMLTIIATPQGNFRLSVQVRWMIVAGQMLEVGFEIIKSDNKWLQFVDHLEPQNPSLPGRLMPPAPVNLKQAAYSVAMDSY